jgi:hypothetical protein
MLRRTVLALTVLGCVSVAYGAAVRLTYFDFFNEGPDADALAILNFTSGPDGGQSVVQIIVSGFTADTDYDIVLRSQDGSEKAKFLNALQTDEKGHATFHVKMNPLDGDVRSCDLEIHLDYNQADPSASLRALADQ